MTAFMANIFVLIAFSLTMTRHSSETAPHESFPLALFHQLEKYCEYKVGDSGDFGVVRSRAVIESLRKRTKRMRMSPKMGGAGIR